MARHIVIGSRRSKLALTQTRWVISKLEALGLPYTFEIKEIVTKGDKVVDRMLSKVGGKGLFVKEIEQALLDEKIDFAVHSVKDMPAELPPGLELASVPEREDPRDCLISKKGLPLEELPQGAVIGTSSLRRSAQILHARPDLQIKWIRGNIDTRLRKLKEEQYDAIILAASGLKRMGWNDEVVTQYLEPDMCLPAVGQGALGIECRTSDQELKRLLAHIHHEQTGLAVTAERTFLAEMGGSCHVPVACYAQKGDTGLVLTGLIASPDGQTVLKERLTGDEPVELGRQVARVLKCRGAEEILAQVKKDLDL
ncbi:hydroxymethylbilane synthase [Caldalkalibacillus uzonensis]|uniref:Porphobilinogen deaminase n=1 Tax=Caldalkalibacillus uzonensis TaxID=353224 RepID=A0ABU0CSS8_9BACI|nr:hydroxymethylbilane synthase [Caldalkalibacillus uzonensis]MDQ0339476.1 hydroxymethylbilane synthase [Caldalkalibacillus uzonensis]